MTPTATVRPEPVEGLITQHLGVWSAAIKRRSTAGRGSSNKIELYGIKKLRELILELAVRGLLVPQDPNDKPASELLKRIAAEKAKLVKEGEIKKNKSLPLVSEEDAPFTAPKGWEWVRVTDIGYDFGQKTPDTNFTYIDVGSIDNRLGLIDSPTTLSPEDAPSRARKLVKNGTVIYSTVRPYLLNIAIVQKDFEPKPIASTAFAVVHPFEGIDSGYVYRYFRSPSFVSYVESVQTGIAYPAINDRQFFNGLFPLPPTAEQHRIVAKVDELMALCDQLEQQTNASLSAHETLVATVLSALTSAADHAQFASSWQRIAKHFDTLFTTEESIDQLKQTILYLMANGALVRFPDNSPKVPLKKILSFGPRNGFSPKESANETVTKVLKLGATSYGKLDLSQVKSFDEDIPPGSHLWLQMGDILVQRGNSHVFVGSNVLIEDDVENTIYPDLMMKLRVTGDALPGYVSLLLSAPQARKHMWERMTGTSGTMPKISKGVVESIPVIVPPAEIQEKVISTIRLLFTLCDQIKVRLSDAQTTQLNLADSLTEAALARA